MTKPDYEPNVLPQLSDEHLVKLATDLADRVHAQESVLAVAQAFWEPVKLEVARRGLWHELPERDRED